MNKISYVLFFLALLSVTPVRAEDGSEKLDKILENQNQILTKLDEIKSELGIVKIRATER